MLLALACLEVGGALGSLTTEEAEGRAAVAVDVIFSGLSPTPLAAPGARLGQQLLQLAELLQLFFSLFQAYPSSRAQLLGH